MLTRSRPLAVLALLSVLAGCGNDGGDVADAFPSPVAMETPAPGVEFRVHDADVTIEIRGALEMDHSDPVRLQVTEILGEATPQATWFLQVGFAEPLFLDEVRLFHVGFDLAPGLYRGPGTYELSEEGASPIEGASGLSSAVIVRLSDLQEGWQQEYDRFVSPCSLEVTEKAVRGVVECAELADEGGRLISLVLRWTLV